MTLQLVSLSFLFFNFITAVFFSFCCQQTLTLMKFNLPGYCDFFFFLEIVLSSVEPYSIV